MRAVAVGAWIVVLAAAPACTFSSTTIIIQSDTEEAGDAGSTGGATTDSPPPGTTGPATSAAAMTSGGMDVTGPGATTDGGEGTTTGCVPTAWYPDGDDDGYGDPRGRVVMACDAPAGHADNGDDCDDTTGKVNPGLDEECDGIDNDCDVAIDEWSPVNALCDNCTGFVDGPSVYYVCSGAVSADDALAACEVKGASLVRIDSQAENDLVNAATVPVGPGDYWIGLRWDGSDWRWGDMTVATFTAWRPTAPNYDGECTELDNLDSGLWNDVPCTDTVTTGGWICEGPA